MSSDSEEKKCKDYEEVRTPSALKDAEEIVRNFRVLPSVNEMRTIPLFSLVRVMNLSVDQSVKYSLLLLVFSF